MMPAISRPTLLRLLLVAVAAGLAAVQAVPLLTAPGGMLPVIGGLGRTEPVPPLRPRPEPAERWAAILERPVFQPGRRPVVSGLPAELPAQGAAAEIPPWVLMGTVVDGDRGSALVRTPAAPQPVILRRGERFEGWMVQSVRRGSVLLDRDGYRVELVLPGGP